MIVNGKTIKGELKDTLFVRAKAIPPDDRPTLFIIMAGANPIVKSFVSIKKKFAESIGVPVREYVFSDARAVTTSSLVGIVQEIAHSKKNGGIVVQLPLPPQVDTQAVLDAIPFRYDIDVLGDESVRLFTERKLAIFPPVVGAIREILRRNSVFLGDKKVAIIGTGRLVGAPASVWFKRVAAEVKVFDITRPPNAEELLAADIIVLGIGKPGFLTPDMVKDGAIVLDAGASEEGGKIVGDAAPEVAEKCALFTPVPGGIGPVTVAVLFQNLFALAQERAV